MAATTKMIRSLDMQSFRVMNVPTPVSPYDAVNRNYVDGKSGAAFALAQQFTGDGTTTDFNLAKRTADNAIFVFCGGVFQHGSFTDAGTGQQVIGNYGLFPVTNADGDTVSQIQFAESVPSGVNIICMYSEVTV